MQASDVNTFLSTLIRWASPRPDIRAVAIYFLALLPIGVAIADRLWLLWTTGVSAHRPR